MNEAETIDACILPALKAAGWGAEGCRIRREYRITEGRIEGHGKRGKALKAMPARTRIASTGHGCLLS